MPSSGLLLTCPATCGAFLLHVKGSMSFKAKHPCRYNGCPALVDSGTTYCKQHTPIYKDDRPSAWRRGYDYKWQGIRDAYLRTHSTCAKCGEKATEVHHIQPLAQGGTHEQSNLVPLCQRCHSRLTASATARAKRTSDYIDTHIG